MTTQLCLTVSTVFYFLLCVNKGNELLKDCVFTHLLPNHSVPLILNTQQLNLTESAPLSKVLFEQNVLSFCVHFNYSSVGWASVRNSWLLLVTVTIKFCCSSQCQLKTQTGRP